MLLPVRALIVSGIAALLVASPFLYAIVWRYHLHVVNRVPMAWQWLPVTADGFPTTLRMNAWLIVAGIAGLAVVRHRVVRAWVVAAAGLTAYGLAANAMAALPAFVPTFHFWRYTLAVLTLLTGATACAICTRIFRKHAPLIIAALGTLAVAVYLPHYQSRFDFVYGRSIATERPSTHADVSAFLRKSTPADAVVLGSRGASLQIIGPAGRRVVAVNANWSNPYIANVARVADREAMLEALKGGQLDRFAKLAEPYRVTHVVGVGSEECRQLSQPVLQLMYEFGDLCVFSRRP
jgi:hypothetical protein